MSVKNLKTILGQVNTPIEVQLEPLDLSHPYYWFWVARGIRIKSLHPDIYRKGIRGNQFDVFIWGGYISPDDYIYKQVGDDLVFKFKRANFPQFIDNQNDPSYTIDGNGNPATPWNLEATDEIFIKGDLERI